MWKWNKFYATVIILAFAVFMNTTAASAGLMDKLKQATDKLNAYNAKQSGQSGQAASTEDATEDPDRPLDLNKQKGFKGSCEGKRSATCMDYMEAMDYCMEPLKGYRMKVTADRIEKKLKDEQLTDKQRKNLEEDLAAAKEAYKNKIDNPAIAGQKNSQRYLNDISEDDQVWINAEYNKFNQKITNKCVGADHMGIGKRTEFGGPTISGDEAVKQMKEKRAQEDAPFECMKKASFVRWAIMADLMEKRMNEKGISGKERADWEADIASLREFAETAEGSMPKAVDPSNPMRAMMRLTDTNDMMTISNETSTKTQELLAECQKQGPQRPKVKLTGTTSQILAAKKVQAKKDAENEAIYQRNKAQGTGGGSLSASLGATDLRYMKTAVKCYDPIHGHMAKVTAEMLERRLKEASGISAEKRKMWQEDIDAWRAAQAAEADQPDPPDPDDPYRWQDYITKEDRQTINSQHAKFVNEINKKCGEVDHMK